MGKFEFGSFVKQAGVLLIIGIFAIVLFNLIFPKGFGGEFTPSDVTPPMIFSVFVMFFVVLGGYLILLKLKDEDFKTKDLIPIIIVAAIIIGYYYYGGANLELPKFFNSIYSTKIAQSMFPLP